MNIREKISNLLLLHSGSMVNFTEMKGYIDSLVIENEVLKASIHEMRDSLQFIAECKKENEEDLCLVNEICDIHTSIFK